jgi:exopolysaccharide biosynthesis polyprenyl glycosylphosphotransferase
MLKRGDIMTQHAYSVIIDGDTLSSSSFRLINDYGYKRGSSNRHYPPRIEPEDHNKSAYSLSIDFIRRNWTIIFTLFTGVIDSLAIILSSIGAYFIRSTFAGTPVIDSSTYFFITGFYWLTLISFGLILGLYRRSFHSKRTQQVKSAAKVYLYTIPAIFSTFFIFKITEFPRMYVFLFVLLLPVFFVVGRNIVHRIKVHLQSKGLGVRNTIIYGDGQDILRVFEKILLYPELGYNIKGFILNGDATARNREYQILKNTLPEYTLATIDSTIREENIECILTPNLEGDEQEFFTILKHCRLDRIKFKLISPEYENLLKYSYVKDIAGIPLYSPPRMKIQIIKISSKRIFDIIGSSLALLFLSPVFLAISAAILIEDGWPIFFKQKRALVKGKGEFYFYKFRSMVKDAEKGQTDLYKQNQTTGGLFLIDRDPRVTRVGKFIRKYSLDEIPQFINVLIGDMSLVGPRPLSLADLNNISDENSMGGLYQLRVNSKPGITGLWQISGRREVGFREMVLLDLYYIENKSILFDLEIMFETVPVVLFGKGGY